ncbi:MAG: tetratricopeptide repeat protein, partial [Flavobacterium sp.]
MNLQFRLILLLVFILSCRICKAQNVQIDSLKNVLSITKTDTAKVSQYNKLADLYKEINPDSTLFYANKATALSVKTGYDFGLATANMNKGNAAVILGNYPVALKYFKNAQNEFETVLLQNPGKKQIINGLARSYASSGVVYSEQSNYTLALTNYEKALALYQKIKDQKSVSKVLINIGIIYKSQQIYPKALHYLKEAYKMQVPLKEENAPITLTNIGVIYFELGEYKNAIQYYEKAKKGFETNQNNRGFALLNNYLGDYYKKQNNTALAHEYYLKSLGL